MTEARLEARVWIECDSHPRLLALAQRWARLFGGEMAIPNPDLRFLSTMWESPEEGRGTHLEWEMAHRNAAEQVSLALEDFEGAQLVAITVQVIGFEAPADVVPARLFGGVG